MYEDPRKADSMISRLSDLLRNTLQDSGSRKFRSKTRSARWSCISTSCASGSKTTLSVEIRIAPEVERALVPQLLLQPLVENSIRHGMNPQSNAVNITVTAVPGRATPPGSRCAIAAGA